jgi:hypothetical protein
MRRFRTALIPTLAALLAPPGVFAADDVQLAVQRVAIFSSGVGFFEAGATVKEDARAELKFRTEQINDILKSLVVQDLDGGRVGVVSYASQDPIEKTLRSFGVDLTGRPTLAALLDQLRGEAVEIGGERAVTGVILGVERRDEKVGDSVVKLDVLNLLTDAGMQQVDFRNIRSVKLLSPQVDQELRKALSTLATAHNADKKTVTLNFSGQGARRVKASYLLEAPIWKTSYRLVLSDDKPPFLQGWATVENATEEDWKDVKLSLVSGRPISFRMDLYTPLYIQRPIEQLELYASLRPPTYEGPVDRDQQLARKVAGRGNAAFQAGIPVAAAAPVADAEESFRMRFDDIGRGSGIESMSAGRESGELFEYVIQTPVSIPRQHSAMLPIVNQEIEGKKVSIFNAATHAKHPLNGLELVNATSLNLMQGPVTVFDGGTYAGDAKLPNLSPKEERLIAYALDLSTEVNIDQKPTLDELVSLKINKGVLIHRHKYVDARTYNIKNKAAKTRTVIVEQPYSQDWKLVQPTEPAERTSNLLRFRVEAPAEKTTALPVMLERYSDETVMLSQLDFDTLRWYLRAPVISPKVKAALERVQAIRLEITQLGRARQQAEAALKQAESEQARIRENIRTLPRDSDQYQRQLKEFDRIEGSLAKLRDEAENARQRSENKQRELEDYLASLELE